ncbi:hypothetical protein NL676_038930 [Syzygium grande]|nr:hypothetical protein NL676_038930 [Syzygium grande]
MPRALDFGHRAKVPLWCCLAGLLVSAGCWWLLGDVWWSIGGAGCWWLSDSGSLNSSPPPSTLQAPTHQAFDHFPVLERFDPTPFAHRFQPVARGSSNMVVSTRRGKGRSRKSTPPISPALNAISVDIKNSLFCTTPKGIDASDEAVKGKSSRGFSYAASSSYIAEDIVAEDNSLDGSHTCTNENGGGFGLSADNSKDSIPFPVLARDPSSPPPQDVSVNRTSTSVSWKNITMGNIA